MALNVPDPAFVEDGNSERHSLEGGMLGEFGILLLIGLFACRYRPSSPATWTRSGDVYRGKQFTSFDDVSSPEHSALYNPLLVNQFRH